MPATLVGSDSSNYKYTAKISSLNQGTFIIAPATGTALSSSKNSQKSATLHSDANTPAAISSGKNTSNNAAGNVVLGQDSQTINDPNSINSKNINSKIIIGSENAKQLSTTKTISIIVVIIAVVGIIVFSVVRSRPILEEPGKKIEKLSAEMSEAVKQEYLFEGKAIQKKYSDKMRDLRKITRSTSRMQKLRQEYDAEIKTLHDKYSKRLKEL